jgi:hypothetical protein
LPHHPTGEPTMYEISEYVNRKRNYSTAILKYPSGKYGIVGSVPIELTRKVESGYQLIDVSKVWNTEQEVIDELLAIGVTKFQLADCSWYQPE